jgi:hypothetical protein
MADLSSEVSHTLSKHRWILRSALMWTRCTRPTSRQSQVSSVLKHAFEVCSHEGQHHNSCCVHRCIYRTRWLANE